MSDRFDVQLKQDRALRDSALALVKADIEHVKQDHSAENVGKRFLGRMTEGAHDVLEQASEKASDQRGILVILIAAITLWFARNPILSLFEGLNDIDAAGTDDTSRDSDIDASTRTDAISQSEDGST